MHSRTSTDSISSLKLSDPVPDDWETIEDEFVMVYAAYQTHIGSDICFAPKATPNDGLIWLLMLSSRASRANILKFLLSMEDGGHINVPGVTMVAVTSLRCVPLTGTGYLTVDGERLPYGPLQATIMPGKARIMTR
ncbi:unnamed protein product [Meganyctiphanes norvegica]|uniref:YegS/DAGK C-terminal domain-containing protein n=1 Tax=Meganyctiphanes norvegica TaxID=48144 RepID=A0AAV2PNC4_MEGNR